jgi:hypothetical protein
MKKRNNDPLFMNDTLKLLKQFTIFIIQENDNGLVYYFKSIGNMIVYIVITLFSLFVYLIPIMMILGITLWIYSFFM